MNTSGSSLADHPFLRTMKREHIEQLAACATQVQFQPGEIIFHENDPANSFYLIEYGKVVLESHGKVPVQTLGSGEALGWSWLFPPFVWHFQARAVEATQAIALNGARLLVACDQDKEFGYELLRRVSQVVIARLQATRAVMGIQR